MSEPIKVGDMAQIVRWSSCGCGLGVIGQVTQIHNPATLKGCHECGQRVAADLHTPVDVGDWCVPMAWLKRIPPLEELQTYRMTDETTV